MFCGFAPVVCYDGTSPKVFIMHRVVDVNKQERRSHMTSLVKLREVYENDYDKVN